MVDILEERYKRGAVIVISEVVPRGWRKLFVDPVIAEAIIDRLSHPSQRLVLKVAAIGSDLPRPNLKLIFGVERRAATSGAIPQDAPQRSRGRSDRNERKICTPSKRASAAARAASNPPKEERAKQAHSLRARERCRAACCRLRAASCARRSRLKERRRQRARPSGFDTTIRNK